MSEREIFNTRAYNFLQGDRQVEGAILELTNAEVLVARNRLPNVLATVAGIADLAHTGWGERVRAPVVVPRNALAASDLDLDAARHPAAAFLPTLLTEAYGAHLLAVEGDELRLRHTPAGDATTPLELGPDHLVVVLATDGGPDADAPTPYQDLALAVLRQAKARGAKLIFVAPRGARLAPAVRPYLQGVWTTAHFAGLNAFALPAVEEAAREAEPTSVLVLSPDPLRAFYTAVGAIDFFLTEDAATRDPRSLGSTDLVTFGRRVAAGATWDGGASQPARTLRELAADHMAAALGVASTEPDPRFRATAEPIALDIM